MPLRARDIGQGIMWLLSLGDLVRAWRTCPGPAIEVTRATPAVIVARFPEAHSVCAGRVVRIAELHSVVLPLADLARGVRSRRVAHSRHMITARALKATNLKGARRKAHAYLIDQILVGRGGSVTARHDDPLAFTTPAAAESAPAVDAVAAGLVRRPDEPPRQLSLRTASCGGTLRLWHQAVRWLGSR